MRCTPLITGTLVLCLLLAGCLGSISSGESGDHDANLSPKDPPNRPVHLDNESAVAYAKQYETVRAYNRTVDAFSGSLTNVSTMVHARLLAATEDGYYVETTTAVGTISKTGDSTEVSDPGVPTPAVYHITSNSTRRVALYPVYPDPDTVSVAVANFDSSAHEVRVSATASKSQKLISDNRTPLASGKGAQLLELNASSTSIRVVTTVDSGAQEPRKVSRPPAATNGWQRIGVVFVVSSDGETLSFPYYQVG